MKVITLNVDSPAHNLAADEALLNHHEEAGEGEALRFWESPTYFVVLGFSNKLSREVHEDVCRTRKIPILRRASGGGTVLQGPGCLNYTLILDSQRDPALGNISSTTRYVLERHREAISALLGSASGIPLVAFDSKPGGRIGSSMNPTSHAAPISLAGESDLIWNGLKFSGNAQRRLRRYVMFHGTFLYDFELSLVECFLQMPERQPEYRANRAHNDFIGNIPLSPERIVEVLTEMWRADGAGEKDSLSELRLVDTIAQLVSERYSQGDWVAKF